MFERLSKSQLSDFGFDAQRFKTVSGGREYQGPCPQCGGKDRLIVSNGMYWCRQCNFSGSLVKLLDDPPSAEELERSKIKFEKQQKIEQAQAKKEKKTKLTQLNKNQIWKQFHSNLLKRPDILELLEKDGITMLGVEKFQLGLIPNFDYWIDGEKFTSEALSFPVFWDKYCYNIRCRILAQIEGDKYRPYLIGMGGMFYLADYPNLDFVVVVEGEKKAIVLWLNGIPTVGIQGNWGFKDKWIPFFKERWKTIFVAFDPDNAGNATSGMVARDLNAIQLRLEGKPDDLFVQGKMTTEKMISILSQSFYKV
jgi:hypothetical protein